MKPFSAIFPLAVTGALAWSLAPVSSGWGQVTSTTTTTTVTQTPDIEGSFSQWIPGTQSVVVSSAGAEPIHYAVTRTTTVVDDHGAPILMDRVAPGVPMTVRYVSTADGLVASKIVVHSTPRGEVIERHEVPAPQAAVTTTTTTTSAPAVVTNRGTIAEFSPASDTVVLGGGERYVITKRTTYVDETGAPVPVEQITRGAPVTVDYVDEGGRRMVSRVIVSHHPAPSTVIERPSTSTTILPER